MSDRAIIILGVVVVSIILLAGGMCASVHTVAPDAGYEAVLIEKPIIFGTGGVLETPIKTGRQYVWRSTSYVMVNMQPQQFSVTFDDLMSSDGVPLDFNAVIRLRVTDSVRLIKEFGQNWYANNIAAEFSNRVRQSVRKYGMNETAIDTSAIEKIDGEVSESMVAYIKEARIPVELLQVTIGKANPPDSIKTQRIETAAQQQRVLTEQQRKLAEDSRKLAEFSRAVADNAYRVEMKLTPDQFLQLETIKMQRSACAAGKCTFILQDGKPAVQPVVEVEKP